MEADEMKKFLQLLDKPSITSKEQFMLECVVAGLECDDKKFDKVIEYEVSQLKNFKHIESMFAEEHEKSLMAYKQVYHLVERAGLVTDLKTLSQHFNAVAVNEDPSKNTNFNMSVELLNDIQMMHGIDTNKELWFLAVQEVLKR